MIERFGQERMWDRPGSSEDDAEQKAFELEDAELTKYKAKGKAPATTPANSNPYAKSSGSGGRSRKNYKKHERKDIKSKNSQGDHQRHKKCDRSPDASRNSRTPAQDRMARGENRVRKY